jgi:hypothetical protein
VEQKIAHIATIPRHRSGWVGRIVSWWPWAPLPLGAAYLLTILLNFNQLIATTYLNGDAASAPVIGELFGGSPAHRQVVLGNMAWFSTLMFELATRWLPLHRQIWEAAPYAMALAGALLIAWGAWRVAGRWAAAISGVLVLCAGPRTLSVLFSLDDHSPTWFSIALLGALLIALEQRPAWLGTTPLTLAIVAIGAVVGVNAASDPLVVIAGLVPALLAAGASWGLQPGRGSARAWWWTLACVVIAGVFDGLTRALMHHENVVPAVAAHNLLASGEAVASNFKLWWQSITFLGNGNFYGQKIGFSSSLQLACAFLSVAAVLWVPRIAWRELAAAAATRRRAALSESAPRIAWCIFWASSAVLLSIGFIFSTSPMEIYSSRYLVGVVFATAALLPLTATRAAPLRVAITAGTVVFALTGWVSLLKGEATINTGNFPSGYVSGQVAQIARREHLAIGYAGYWDAATITWATHLAVKVYPVQPCGAGLCPFYLHYISSWYTPHPGLHTFLIVDPTQPAGATPVPSLGKPIAVRDIDELTMYVYPYDIASRLQR